MKSSGEKSEAGFEVPCRRLACGFPRQLFENNSININSLVFGSLRTREKALICSSTLGEAFLCGSSSGVELLDSVPQRPAQRKEGTLTVGNPGARSRPEMAMTEICLN